MKVDRKIASITGSAVVLVGLGIAGGILMVGSGAPRPADPVRVVQVGNQRPAAPVGTITAAPVEATPSAPSPSAVPAAAPTPQSIAPSTTSSTPRPTPMVTVTGTDGTVRVFPKQTGLPPGSPTVDCGDACHH